MKFEDCLEENFSGALSVVHHGRSIYRNAYGYADLANRVPNETDTKFATASAGKVFVATAILKLIQEDKLSFDTRIGELLDYDLHHIHPCITVRQLLNHTSGIPDYFDESIMDRYEELWRDFPNYKIRSSADLVPLFIHKPMMYPPGERFQYNNTGYVVLGLIIERMTGISFDAYLKQSVFEPCGMMNTGYYELDRLPAKCANAYIHDAAKQEFYTNIYSVDVKGTGAGGAFTTVLDIERFWNGLFSLKIIALEMLDLMLAPQVEKQCYGYGIWLKRIDDQTLDYRFEGCDPGVSFISSYNKQQDLLVTLVSNFGCDVWRAYKNIVKLYTES